MAEDAARGDIFSTIQAFIERHPVLTYFVLVFVISWGAGLLIVGPGGLPLSWERFEKLGALLYIGILAGPFLAGILLTGLIDGRAGLRELLARLRRWRVGARWYALALLPALVITATVLLLSLLLSVFRPAIIESNDKTGIVMLCVGPSLLFGFFEEIGWTGFAVPRLRSRHAVMTTGLTVGLVWGAWHFPLFWEANTFSGALPLAILLVRLFSWLPAFRVLMVWIYERTGSLLVVMLMHAALVATQLILRPEALTGANLLTQIGVLPAVMWLLLAAVALANRGQLSQPPIRSSLAERR
jgi:membrane protease YdiL (CAAX protease family)